MLIDDEMLVIDVYITSNKISMLTTEGRDLELVVINERQ
jgi:hypothetical protein